MFKFMCCVVMLASIWAPQMWAQSPRGTPTVIDMANMGNQRMIPVTARVDPVRARMELLAAQRENQDRQIALKRDTDKLLALANELKQNVDRTGPDILSVDVVKKAQEIEKLAKSVKDKMKGD
jgi:hypothetical protein